MNKKVLDNLLYIAMTALIFFIMIVLLRFNTFSYATKKWLFEKNVLILVIAVVIFCILYVVLSKITVSLNSKILYPISIVLCLFQIYYIYSYYNVVGYDILKVLNNSYNLAHFGELISRDKWYFEAWPNNIFILHTYTLLIKILTFLGSTNINFMLIILNCILSCFSGILLFKIINRLFKNVAISWFGYILYILMIVFSPHISVIYTDALGVNLPILILYVYLKYVDNNTVLKLICIGILSAVAYSLKPHTFVIVISLIIYELLFKNSNIKNKFKFIILIFISAFISLQLISYQTKYIREELDYDKRVGYLHYMKMSLNPKWAGLYSHEDFADSRKISNKKDRDSHNIAVIKDRIVEHTLESYLKFMVKKTLVNYNDGTFGWYFIAENNSDTIVAKNNTKLSEFANSLYIYKKSNYDKFYIEKQMYWLFILFMITISLIKSKTDSHNFRSIFFINFIGVFILVTVFEASARYLFTNVPMFIILGMYGVNNLVYCKDTLYTKLKKGSEK